MVVGDVNSLCEELSPVRWVSYRTAIAPLNISWHDICKLEPKHQAVYGQSQVRVALQLPTGTYEDSQKSTSQYSIGTCHECQPFVRKMSSGVMTLPMKRGQRPKADLTKMPSNHGRSHPRQQIPEALVHNLITYRGS